MSSIFLRRSVNALSRVPIAPITARAGSIRMYATSRQQNERQLFGNHPEVEIGDLVTYSDPSGGGKSAGYVQRIFEQAGAQANMSKLAEIENYHTKKLAHVDVKHLQSVARKHDAPQQTGAGAKNSDTPPASASSAQKSAAQQPSRDTHAANQSTNATNQSTHAANQSTNAANQSTNAANQSTNAANQSSNAANQQRSTPAANQSTNTANQSTNTANQGTKSSPAANQTQAAAQQYGKDNAATHQPPKGSPAASASDASASPTYNSSGKPGVAANQDAIQQHLKDSAKKVDEDINSESSPLNIDFAVGDIVRHRVANNYTAGIIQEIVFGITHDEHGNFHGASKENPMARLENLWTKSISYHHLNVLDHVKRQGDATQGRSEVNDKKSM